MQFIQPIWLFAIAGIAIPVIIHLWNVRQGKTLKIASIRLLTQSSRQTASSLKLRELLLLFLRCLLISLLAAILAKPLWPQSPSEKTKGWIVMEEQGLPETYSRFKPLIDSLSKAGFEFHYFRPGFAKTDFEKALKAQQDSMDHSSISYWKLLEAMQQEVASNLPVYLFTTNSLERFAGNRPRMSINVKWNAYTPADSISTWPMDAYFTTSDSIRLITAESKPGGTFFKFENLAGNEVKNSTYNVETLEGKIFLTTKAAGANNPGAASIEVDTSILRIMIFEGGFANDARYLKAAIEAIQRFTSRKINVSVVNKEEDISRGLDWLFWLSARPLSMTRVAKKIFMYEEGKQQSLQSWIRMKDASTSGEPALFKRVLSDDSSGERSSVVWQDGFGHPLLNLEKENQQEVYHFFSRFDPAWNDLPWSEEFPAMMLHLLVPNKSIAASPQAKDKRILDNNQILPAENLNKSSFSQNKAVEYSSLINILWVAAFLIFFIERIISLTAKNKEIHG